MTRPPEPVQHTPAFKPFEKNSIAITISREMALAYGMVEPTPEEAAEMERSRNTWQVRRDQARAEWVTIWPRLSAMTGLERTLLDLHCLTMAGECQECTGDQWVDWPCSTVVAVAAHHGITLPDIHEAAWTLEDS